MDLAEIFRVMRRRWLVLVPGLLVTAALVVAVYAGVPTKYQSQSTVELLNSQKATVAFDGNPFLSTQTALTSTADILARNLNSDAAIADLKAQGLTGTYVAMIADNAQGPLLWLTVTGTDKAAVLHSDTLLTAYAAQRLQQFQAQQSVSADAMIRMTTIVPPQNPVAQLKTKIEYLVMAGLVGVVGSLFLAFYVEAKRRPRPVERSLDEELAPATGTEDEDEEDPEADGDPDESGPEVQHSVPREHRDEDLEQPTVQLSLLQLQTRERQRERERQDKDADSQAPWFAP